MTKWLIFTAVLLAALMAPDDLPGNSPPTLGPAKKVYVLPIREDIMPPLVYVVRRGVKEAMEAKADVLVLDMETNGGRVDVTEEIIGIIGKFPGQTVTFVNKKAFSAGAFISFATQKIYMAPQSVIGAAAPVMASPTGGTQEIGGTMEVKASSAISALVRANAEKNGHNPAVADAMVKKTSELKLDDKVINEKGQILTLTDQEAAREYGTPSKPLLSAGTIEHIEALLQKLNLETAQVKRIEPSGMEKLASWINGIAPLLLIIGIAGIYIEFKTPGFGLPGIIGISAFAVYFFGGYVAGLTGLEWVALFVVGIALVVLELFFFPGTLVLGLTGFALVLVSLVMAMVDLYPGAPSLPTLPQLAVPLNDLALAAIGAIVAILILSRVLPRTSLYPALVSQGASAMQTQAAIAATQQQRLGQVGVALSPLRPGGKAQFGDDILDVVTEGDLIEKGRKVRVIGSSGHEVVVEAV
ncbi:MAG: NfeD family protein [Limisphaerales bacterium]